MTPHYTTNNSAITNVRIYADRKEAQEIARGLRHRGVSGARVYERRIKAGCAQIRVWVVIQLKIV